MGPQQGLWFLNSHITIQLSSADGADGISVMLIRMDRNDAPPLHVHRSEDEIFHITEGCVKFRLGDQTVMAQSGQTILGPRGVPHGFRVVSDEARMLVITHGGFERLVRSMARPAESDRPPPQAEPTPEMQAALVEACAAVDIDILGPPID